MKKLINKSENVLSDMLYGLEAVCGDVFTSPTPDHISVILLVFKMI